MVFIEPVLVRQIAFLQFLLLQLLQLLPCLERLVHLQDLLGSHLRLAHHLISRRFRTHHTDFGHEVRKIIAIVLKFLERHDLMLISTDQTHRIHQFGLLH